MFRVIKKYIYYICRLSPTAETYIILHLDDQDEKNCEYVSSSGTFKHYSSPRAPQHTWLPTAPGMFMCVHCCVCALWMG